MGASSTSNVRVSWLAMRYYIFEISALMHEGYSSLSLYVFVYYWLSILYDESKKIGILLGLPLHMDLDSICRGVVGKSYTNQIHTTNPLLPDYISHTHPQTRVFYL